MKCTRCGSFAINPEHHGRQAGVDLDLCDVCYWRKRAEQIQPVNREKLTFEEFLKALESIEHPACWTREEQENALWEYANPTATVDSVMSVLGLNLRDWSVAEVKRISERLQIPTGDTRLEEK